MQLLINLIYRQFLRAVAWNNILCSSAEVLLQLAKIIYNVII